MTGRTTLDLLAEGRSAPSIAGDLRREFEKAFQSIYGSRPERDPMLSVLFQAVAVQVARVYDDAEHVFPDRVIDDLVASLGLPVAAAIPAQTVVAFTDVRQREHLPAETKLVGYSRTGEEVRFAPDAAIQLAPCALRLAAVVDAGRLTTIAGATVDDDDTPLPLTTVPCRTARAPMLFLALECKDGDPSHIGIHLDSAPLGGEAGRALARSPWHLLSEDSVVTELGAMIPTEGRGGVRMLRWAVPENRGDAADAPESRPGLNLEVAEGPYGHQTVVLPWVSATRRWTCRPPAMLVDALRRVVPDEHREVYEKPLVWLSVSLPAGVSNVATALQGVTLNAVTASNIEIMGEQISFERNGTAVTVRPEGVSDRFLLGAQSILGEQNDPYFPESEIDAPPGVGRYRLDRDRVFLEPARSQTGRTDRHVQLRLIVTDGERGNGVEVGRVARIQSTQLENAILQVTNLTPSRGGTNPPEYSPSRDRLAEALRSRERAITVDDFLVLTKAFEPRVKRVSVEFRASISDRTLQPIHVVRVAVSRRDFGDPDSEFVRLRALLESYLQQRALIGQVVQVQLEELP